MIGLALRTAATVLALAGEVLLTAAAEFDHLAYTREGSDHA